MKPTFEGGVIVGLFGLFGKKKADLLELQKLVLKDSPNKLILSEKQLKSMAAQAAARDLEIINDCVRIIGSTKKPDVFFTRLALLIKKADDLRTFEKHIRFSGASPSLAYGEIFADMQECIGQFLVRYFMDIFDQASNAKTVKGKLAKYQKFYDSLQPYYDQMNKENIDYIETKYRAYTRSLTK